MDSARFSDDPPLPPQRSAAHGKPPRKSFPVGFGAVGKRKAEACRNRGNLLVKRAVGGAGLVVGGLGVVYPESGPRVRTEDVLFGDIVHRHGDA